jgi:hypothetical protein
MSDNNNLKLANAALVAAVLYGGTSIIYDVKYAAVASIVGGAGYYVAADSIGLLYSGTDNRTIGDKYLDNETEEERAARLGAQTWNSFWSDPKNYS